MIPEFVSPKNIIKRQLISKNGFIILKIIVLVNLVMITI